MSDRADAMRGQWLETNKGTIFHVQFTADEVLDLASNVVPLTVVAVMRDALDWQDQARRRAARPARGRKQA